jgi:hypothetical protein
MSQSLVILHLTVNFKILLLKEGVGCGKTNVTL